MNRDILKSIDYLFVNNVSVMMKDFPISIINVLNNFKSSRSDTYRICYSRKYYYYYKISCMKCNEFFFTRHKESKFCTNCSNKDENNPMYGKNQKESTKKLISNKLSGEGNHWYGTGGPMINKHHTNITKKKLSDAHSKNKHYNWKGGYRSNNIPTYDVFISRLKPYGEECRRNEQDSNVLEVRCSHHECRKWFIPTLNQVWSRVLNIDYDLNRFYCCNECKNLCPIYKKSAATLQKQIDIANGLIKKELRQIDSLFKKLVLEKDNYTCQLCNSTEQLQVHHEIPVKINPLLQNDVDNGITLCKDCHFKVHTELEGCTFSELRNLCKGVI